MSDRELDDEIKRGHAKAQEAQANAIAAATTAIGLAAPRGGRLASYRPTGLLVELTQGP